ncbi:hypothetical protein B7R25_14685 [Subtercola boreus]|uniref:peptide chain release factor N(5)-glutamine methyltransferase n=1 Tax=Subtercola boreus TaxID=120213 RepID=A0A3E0W7G2_9MICO|nr:hypothetical protein B7R24_14655 [Subtercola boreus]RFA18572.1 hypothetical protein B7R23_14690 [Subtercola boreus]RFA25090.1 hypothetical protein B7R25_14685 [Subtercola boreus]
MPPTADEIVRRLRAAGCVFAEDEAALLLEAARSGAELEAMVARRVEGFPLEHILGWAEFAGLRIRVADRVFVPRRRTEFLAQVTVSLTRDANTGPHHPTPVVLDLCCGSGAIAAVVEASIPQAVVYAADLDPAATQCARQNLSHPDRVFTGDLFAALPPRLAGTVDVIVANTPYVPTDALELMPPEARLHEARFALDGGTDGLDLQRRIATEATRWLAPGGHLLVEVNEAQAHVASGIFETGGLHARTLADDEYEVTVVIGTAPFTNDLFRTSMDF